MWFDTSRFGHWNGSFSHDSQVRPAKLSDQTSETSVVSAPQITHEADPRWVLAQRTIQVMQGSVLGPEKRGRLIKLGKLLGLSPFDANVIIAIVQNQAREGNPRMPDLAGSDLLALVPPPTKRAPTKLNLFTVGVCAALLLLIEVIFFLSWSQT